MSRSPITTVRPLGEIEISGGTIVFDSRPMAAPMSTVRLVIGKSGFIVRVHGRERGRSVGTILSEIRSRKERAPRVCATHLIEWGLTEIADGR